MDPRLSARLDRFMDDDIKSALGGVENLIKKLNKVVTTLNPQDEARGDLEMSKRDLMKTYNLLKSQVSNISHHEI